MKSARIEKQLLPHWAAARIRLGIAAAIGVAVSIAVPHRQGVVVRALEAWDSAALVFLLLMFRMMAEGTPESMRRRAAIQDAGRWAILFVIVAGSLFSLAGLVSLQERMKTAVPDQAVVYLGLIAATILLSWSVAHAIFALHYAHAYYGAANDPADEDGLVGGLEFPSENRPDYWDFMYFSFVVGMTCQVSDVQIGDRYLRRLALIHGIVSFFFNTIILALTINVAASLI